MQIIPAIDLKDGQCVRLTQGDFNTAKIYEADPVLQAFKFAAAGAETLHMVDLDGARLGEMQQFDVVARVAKETPLKVQVGGGVRGEKTVEALLNAGVERVVIGSLAVKSKLTVRDWIRKFGPEHIVLAFDVRFKDGAPEALTHGWQSGSEQVLWDILDAYEGSGLKHILCTDVDRDGMLSGTNEALYTSIMEHNPSLQVQASGGVSELGDLLALAKLKVAGAIVGKAIYENRIELVEAIDKVKNAG